MQLDTIYWGDCKDILSEEFSRVDKYFADVGLSLPKECADLIYLDPPFFSNRKYEQVFGDDDVVRSFDDNKWGYGLDGLKSSYLPYMRDRIQKCYNVLKPTGSFYLHCDWHACHYLKQICDDIFGYNNFQNEIIWHYGLGAANRNAGFLRKHDNIYYYTKSKNFTFNKLRGDVTPQMKAKYCHQDDIGQYMLSYGKKYYLKGGKPFDDMWDIPTLSATAKERLGYPTQKPKALLERIIKASSNPGEIVLDPFCGCGTTLDAAYELDRHYIGIDLSQKACWIVNDRLKKAGATPSHKTGGDYSPNRLKKLPPFEFQEFIIKIFLQGRSNRRTGDGGIDGWTDDDNPIQVKQSEKVGRPVLDQFETALNRYYSQLGNDGHKKRGVIIAYSFTDGAFAEQRRAIGDGIYIELMSVIQLYNKYKDRLRVAEVEAGWD